MKKLLLTVGLLVCFLGFVGAVSITSVGITDVTCLHQLQSWGNPTEAGATHDYIGYWGFDNWAGLGGMNTVEGGGRPLLCSGVGGNCQQPVLQS